MKGKKTNIVIIMTLFIISVLISTSIPIAMAFLSKGDSNAPWKLEYDFQEGTREKVGPKKPVNKYLDFFFGDSLFKYDSFYETNQGSYYNGNWSQVKKTKSINKALICWKNDFQSKQLILFKNHENDSINNLNIEVKPLFNQTDSKIAPIFKVQFIKPIRATNKVSRSSIYKGSYYSFDEISNEPKLENLDFKMQPMLLSATTTDNTTPGTFLYQVAISFNAGTKRETIKFGQKIIVVDKNIISDNYGTHGKNDFGYESMIFPHNSQKFISKDYSPSILSKKKDLIVINNPQFIWNSFHGLDESQWFLKEKNIKSYESWARDCVDSLNMSYGYFTDLGLPYLKMIIKNEESNPNDLESIEILNHKKELEDLIKNPNLSLKLSFDVFDQFVNFFKNANYTKIYIPAIIRNIFNIPVYYSSKNYPFLNEQSSLPQVLFQNRFIDEEGFLTDVAKTFYNHIFPAYLKQLSNHIKNKIADGAYLNFKGEPFKFFFSFDETKYEVNKFIWNVIKREKLDNLFGSHVYVGWEYQVENNPSQIQEYLINNWDELSLQPFPFLNWDNGEKIADIIQERKSLGYITRFYSTWRQYPGSYLGSNPAESYWGPLLARSVNANGWHKFQLDGFRNDISLDKEDNSAVYEPGDAYQLYPGSGNGPNLSLRLVNFIEAIKTVWKLNQLQKENEFQTFDLLKNIKLTKNANQNTPYKWNLAYWNWEHLQKMNLKKDLRISEQTEFVKVFIYEYTKNKFIAS